ncbi:MAG: fumarylacetoacetate hydrolase family protein [Ramlibacter sp.]|nr:fumarylacetoacetate hydrolase family protein [Ramlibacter sp.]
MKTVVGALLNFRGAWEAMEPAMHKEPHFKPPVHPVLYIKPANTWSLPGCDIVLPAEVEEVEVGATLGIVLKRTAARVRVDQALSFVAGYVVVNDVTIPHTNILRPPLRQKCRDGFCPIGPMTDASQVADPDALELRAYVNGELRQSSTTANLMRSVAQLISDVSEYMSLCAGDILLVGVPEDPPRARPGDEVSVEIAGLGRVTNPVVREQGVSA